MLKLSPEALAPRLNTLSATQLEALLEAALEFESYADLEKWLAKQS
ncbi:MAG: DUF4351 domain-containing protein [Silvanigrellaceae bacterium]